jgi:hypothetical protein
MRGRRSYRPFSGIARRLGYAYNVRVSPIAAKENQMKLRLTTARAERDERVTLMLDRHVRAKYGSAPVQLVLQQPLQRRLALAYVRA